MGSSLDADAGYVLDAEDLEDAQNVVARPTQDQPLRAGDVGHLNDDLEAGRVKEREIGDVKDHFMRRIRHRRSELAEVIDSGHIQFTTDPKTTFDHTSLDSHAGFPLGEVVTRTHPQRTSVSRQGYCSAPRSGTGQFTGSQGLVETQPTVRARCVVAPDSDRVGARPRGYPIDMRPEPIAAHAPRPVRRPVMVQRWMLISFLHWRVDVADLRPLVPQELEIDELDGSAWVGLVPFRMTTQIPGVPALPRISTFPETNVRTYVTGPDGGRGIWFFSLDVARSPTALAGAALGLPYRWSSMRMDGSFGDVTYGCRRLVPTGSVASITRVVSTGDPAPMTAREHFLVSRFRLYWTGPGGLLTLDVDHEPWTLHAGRTRTLDDGLVEAAGIRRPLEDPVTHHAVGATHVRVGAPRRVSARATRVPAGYTAIGARRRNMKTVERSIDVDVPVSTAYNQWTQFEDFPRFMEGVESVEQIDDTRVRWVADVAGERRSGRPRSPSRSRTRSLRGWGSARRTTWAVSSSSPSRTAAREWT